MYCPQVGTASFSAVFSDAINVDGHQGRVVYPAEDASTFSLMLCPIEYQTFQSDNPSSMASQARQCSNVFTGFMQFRHLSKVLTICF